MSRFFPEHLILLILTLNAQLMRSLAIVLVSMFLVIGFCIGKVSGQDSKPFTQYSDHKRIPGYHSLKLKNPQVFQGNKRTRKYFEGWYFKMVSGDGKAVLSVIPGISLSEEGKDQHAFIQIIDGRTALTDYYIFPVQDFYFSSDSFAIRIGNNYFSKEKLILDISNDSTSIRGEIQMRNLTELPVSSHLNTGIMGWYRFVPFMQCYHGVVSLNHQLEGTISINNKKYSFSEGKGYIEKDWGSSMPSAWIWMQSNNFGQNNTSLMLSVAHIPWLGSSFTGFLGFLLYNGKIHRFATYTHAKINIQTFGPDSLSILINDKKYQIYLDAIRSKSGMLKAPMKGSMDRRIPEGIDAKLFLRVFDKKGMLVLSDSTSIAGLELVGDVQTLIRKERKKQR